MVYFLRTHNPLLCSGILEDGKVRRSLGNLQLNLLGKLEGSLLGNRRVCFFLDNLGSLEPSTPLSPKARDAVFLCMLGAVRGVNALYSISNMFKHLVQVP